MVEYRRPSGLVLGLEICLRCGIAVKPAKVSVGRDRNNSDGRLVG
jgi:hypothetical protein